MARQFNRVAAVKIAPRGAQGVAVDERFRISFQVTKSLGRETNSANVQLFNLAASTRSEIIDKGEVIQLEAGYEGASEVLFIADITRAIVKRDPPDIMLDIQCQDGIIALRDKRVNLSFAPGTPVARVISAIEKELGLVRADTGTIVAGAYREGVAFSGPVGEVLDKVTAKAFLDWSIQDNSLQLLEPGTTLNAQGVKLTPKSGLIDAPEPLKDKEGRAGAGYKVRSLLNPKIRPGERLVLASSGVPTTELRIDSVTHAGDIRGRDWMTEAECYAD